MNLFHRKTKLILEEKNYKEGRQEGIQKRWYENTSVFPQVSGQLQYEENYKKGKLEGIQKWWYIDGQLMYEYKYKEGKLEGIQKFLV